MDESETCGNCRYWHPAWKFKRKSRLGNARTPIEIPDLRQARTVKRSAERGLCRRYAPQASALTTVWMETMVWDWCGDYEAGGGEG